jgi:hypothetical protein
LLIVVGERSRPVKHGSRFAFALHALMTGHGLPPQ